MKALSLLLSLAALTSPLLTGKAEAQTLLTEYSFASGVRTATNVDSRLTAGLIASANASFVSTSGSAANLYYLLKPSSTLDLAHTQTAALAGTAYVSFTLTPSPGLEAPLELGKISFDFGNHGASFTLHAYAFITVMIDGDLITRTAHIYNPASSSTLPYFEGQTGGSATNTVGKAVVDLSGLILTEATTFNLYTYYDSLERPSGTDPLPSGTAYSLRIDNIQVHAIPEPSSLALFASLSLLGLCLSRGKA